MSRKFSFTAGETILVGSLGLLLAVLLFAGFTVIGCAVGLLYAYVAHAYYYWFFHDAFHLPEISVLRFWTIFLFVSLFRSTKSNRKKEDEVLGKIDAVTSVMSQFLGTAMLWLVGYTIHRWWL